MSAGKNWDDCEDSEICSIIGDTLAYDVSHPKYPKEWIRGKNGPECTAFIPVDRGLPVARCECTIDMFKDKP